MRRLLQTGWLAIFGVLPLLACSALGTLGQPQATQAVLQPPQIILVPTPAATSAGAEVSAQPAPEVTVNVAPVVTTASTTSTAEYGRPQTAASDKNEYLAPAGEEYADSIEIIIVEVRPPDPRPEVRPPSPYAPGEWVSGHWSYRHGRWVWVAGYWLDSRPGHGWIAGHWEQRGHRWVWIPGHWAVTGGSHPRPPGAASNGHGHGNNHNNGNSHNNGNGNSHNNGNGNGNSHNNGNGNSHNNGHANGNDSGQQGQSHPRPERPKATAAVVNPPPTPATQDQASEPAASNPRPKKNDRRKDAPRKRTSLTAHR
jgi:WXXGXW repeat (2 copies)